MRRLKFDLDFKSLQIIYFSFIRPLLEYADIVWNNFTQYECNKYRFSHIFNYLRSMSVLLTFLFV